MIDRYCYDSVFILREQAKFSGVFVLFRGKTKEVILRRPFVVGYLKHEFFLPASSKQLDCFRISCKRDDSFLVFEVKPVCGPTRFI